MALKVPGNASLPSHSHYTTCTSWVIFFPQKYGKYGCQNQYYENRPACNLKSM